MKLEELEKESIKIIQQTMMMFPFENVGTLWSMGKDSTVLLHLIKKAIKDMPLIIHIDTKNKMPKMIEYRNNFLSSNNYDNIICINNKYDVDNLNKIDCCYNLKTIPLNDVIYNTDKCDKYKVINHKLVKINQKHQIKALFVGIRYDEEQTRRKEKIFSKRYKNDWDIEHPQLQIWNFFSYDYDENSHYRVHPLLHWTEIDIWKYIKKYDIEYLDYYNSDGNYRYRTLGCQCCTNPQKSSAKNLDEIISELQNNKTPERKGRLQDDEFGLEKLRLKGYM